MIDLRSDILAPLRPEVAAAFVAAAERPPAFAPNEDPDERALQDEIADLFGFEAALLVPTGTMANQIALRLACGPGEALVADAEAHVAVNEAASTDGLNGVRVVALDGPDGHPTPKQVAAALRPAPATSSARHVRLVWAEDTHNRAGGTLAPRGQSAVLADLASDAGAKLHIDGARIWNALAAGDGDARAIAWGADTLALNLNKGLGAPLGALLLGSTATVDEAAAVRRMFGGWWRPLGPVAAAGRAVLPRYRERLQVHHALARRFAERVGAPARPPQTNLVMVRNTDPVHLAERLRQKGVLASPYGATQIRFAFHGGIDARAADGAANALCALLKG